MNDYEVSSILLLLMLSPVDVGSSSVASVVGVGADGLIRVLGVFGMKISPQGEVGGGQNRNIRTYLLYSTLSNSGTFINIHKSLEIKIAFFLGAADEGLPRKQRKVSLFFSFFSPFFF